MSSVPLPILFIMAVFFTFWLILRKFHRLEQKKRALPDLAGYLDANKQAEARCSACDCTEFKDEGLSHGKDARRIISCARCNTLLYRFDPPEQPG
ncbi:hypothetical protein AAG895_11485 [Thauera sp. JM12B12]|uniref:hypothetical protein n=1 Tax=Thauera sp. JM12B12 TaxID=3142262 RepID=UPI0031F43EC2